MADRPARIPKRSGKCERPHSYSSTLGSSSKKKNSYGFVYHAPREVEVDGPCAASFGYGSRSFSVKAAGGFALLAIWFALGTIAFYYFKQLSLTDAFFDRCLLPRAAGIVVGSLCVLGPVRFVRNRRFHFYSPSAATLAL